MDQIVSVKLIGLRELQAKLGKIPVVVQNRLRPFMAEATLNLKALVKSNIVQRFRSTGPLYQSVKSKISEEPGKIEGRVYTDGVTYAAIQEYGGTTPAHEILPVNGSVLAFMSPSGMGFSSGGGMNGMVFARRVMHPGSRIPERSYAREALAYSRFGFERGIREIVSEAVREPSQSFAMAAE